jgi:hypothetical protein
MVSFVPAERIAPMIVMPEIAFEPDIKGVCKMGGILVITSNPTNMARTNTVSSPMNISMLPTPL